MSIVSKLLSALLPMLGISYVLNLFPFLYLEQIIIGMLGMSLFLVLEKYNKYFAFFVLGVSVYLFFRFPVLSNDGFENIIESSLVSAILVGTILFCCYVSASRSLFFVVLCFMLYAVFGQHIPNPTLQSRDINILEYITFLGMSDSGVFGIGPQIFLEVILLFLFFSSILKVTGGTDWIIDASRAMVQHQKGGPAKIAIVASSIFGTISGSTIANTVSTGVITIPIMLKSGYKRTVAAAYEAIASTGGQIVPPIMGAAVFIMSDIIDIPYAKIAVAAIIPAFLYYFPLFLHAHYFSSKNINLKDEKLDFSFKKGWYFVLPFVVIIVSLYYFNLEPDTAVLYASAALLVACVNKLSIIKLFEIFVETGRSATSVIVILLAASLAVGTLEYTSLGYSITYFLTSMGYYSLPLLLIITATTCIILGMGMPTIPAYLLVAHLCAPALVEMGIPLLAAHLFVYWFAILANITPPIAICSFTAASIAKADPMKTSLEAVKICWVVFLIPFLIVYFPNILLFDF